MRGPAYLLDPAHIPEQIASLGGGLMTVPSARNITIGLGQTVGAKNKDSLLVDAVRLSILQRRHPGRDRIGSASFSDTTLSAKPAFLDPIEALRYE